MKLYTHLSQFDKIPKAIVALGAFDGIHLGHRKIISRIVDAAKRESGTSVVFTFSNHPLSVINAEKCPFKIVAEESKIRLIGELEVDVLCNVPFTSELHKMSAAEFIELLREKYDLRHIVVGANYRYGRNGAGNGAALREAGEKYGFTVEIVDIVETILPFSLEKIPVSSTAVRQFINEGKAQEAAFLLGRLFSVAGKVVKGDGRGRTFGYPTANISIACGVFFPADGVYAVNVKLDANNDRAKYFGVANIGSNPTFSGKERRMEVHILDFSEDVYGQNMTIEFLGRLRKETAFKDISELKKQISRDIENAKTRFFYKDEKK